LASIPQVDPGLTALGLSALKYYEPLSKLAFEFNLRRYNLAWIQTDRQSGGLGDIAYPLVSDLKKAGLAQYRGFSCPL
jgi:hypothetical protein